MNLGRSELQDAARQAFGATPLASDPAHIWKQLVEMGWLGMCVPERLGGLGLGREAQAVIHFELGRSLGPGSVTTHLAAIDTLVTCERTDWLKRAMAGKLVTASMQLETADEESGMLSGRLNAIPDADRAEALLVAASDRMILLPMSCPQIRSVEAPMWDKSRRLFTLTLDLVPVEAGVTLGRGEDAFRLWDDFNAHILRAISGDSLGGAGATLDMTVDYLKVRSQFDRPLAMFQALKHRCADLNTALAAAEAIFWADAAGQSTNSVLDVTRIGALKAHAARTYHEIVEEAVQLHGGIALTAEHQCHRFLKRAMLNGTLGGSADTWEEAFGRRMITALTSP